MLQRFKFTTAGESHGRGMLVIVEGVPAGLMLAPADVTTQLARRQLGYGRGGRMKIEEDAGEILSGVRLGETLGSPLAIWIPNRDHENWEVPMSVAPRPGADEETLRRVHLPRPGHADLVGMLKYGRKDARDVLERASARETAGRVAAGAVARKLLAELDVEIGSRVVRIGEAATAPAEDAADPERLRELLRRADASDVRCADESAAEAMRDAIRGAGRAGDSVGGVFEVVAFGVPVGLGSHVSWDRRLDARIAAAMMGIQAMKGVEIGMGFRAAARRGSDVHDEIETDPGRRSTGGYRRRRNNAGGLEGGTTTGEPLVVRVAMKPLSSLRRPLDSVDLRTGEPAEAQRERSDICAVPAAAVIGEAMLAVVLADAALEKFGGDCLADVLAARDGYLARINDASRGGA